MTKLIMLKIRRNHRILLSTLLFIGILLLQFHHHDNEQSGEQCPICIVQELFDISDAPQLFFQPATLASLFLAFSAQIIFIPFTSTLKQRSRAPPLFF